MARKKTRKRPSRVARLLHGKAALSALQNFHLRQADLFKAKGRERRAIDHTYRADSLQTRINEREKQARSGGAA